MLAHVSPLCFYISGVNNLALGLWQSEKARGRKTLCEVNYGEMEAIDVL